MTTQRGGAVLGVGTDGKVREVGALTVTSKLVLPQGIELQFAPASMFWEEADANAKVVALDLPSSGAEVPIFVVGTGVDGVDLGMFDGLSQPMVATLDADRDSYVGFHYSADDVGVVKMRLGSGGTVRSHTLPDVASDTFAMLAATQTLTNKTITIADDGLLGLGTDGDGVILNRSTSLGANTALSSVLIGTPVTGALPANSLMISDVTASGDIAFYANTGGNSQEYMRFDSSAGATIFNEGSADIDFRIESNDQAYALVLDSASNVWAFWRSVTTNAGILIGSMSRSAPADTNWYHLDVAPGLPTTIPSGTAPLVTTARFTEPAIDATGTVTNAATVYIQNAPTEGGTDNLSLWVDAGVTRLDGGIRINSTSTDALISEATSGSGTVTHYIGNQTITTSSDVRLKQDIEDSTINATEMFRRMRVVDFAWADPDGNGLSEQNRRGRFTGMLAQEMIDVAPWIINAPDPGCPVCRTGQECAEHTSRWFVQYDHLVPALVKGFQEVDHRLAAFEKENAILHRQLEMAGIISEA